MMKIKALWALFLLLPWATAINAQSGADKVHSILRDTTEQARTVRTETFGKWLPIPIPISNPTIGTGLQAALLYLHPKKSDRPGVPNATSGIGGMYTDSESTLFGVFHDNYLADDRYRLRVFAGKADLNLDYFVTQGNNLSFQYNIMAYAVFSQFLTRLPKTENWYLGLRHFWIDAELKFAFDKLLPDLPPVNIDSVTSSLGIILNYDSRNDNYCPTSGQVFEFAWLKDSDSWGSDYDFDKLTTNYKYYWPITMKQTIAFRAVFSNVGGDAPFYLLSGLDLRGFSASRYLGNSSLSAHGEWRYKLFPRWGVVAFTELGRVASSISDLDKSDTITSYGFGVRWQAIKSKTLNLGVDVAFSDDDNAVYIRVGESF